jgi:hypothetical protein
MIHNEGFIIACVYCCPPFAVSDAVGDYFRVVPDLQTVLREVSRSAAVLLHHKTQTLALSNTGTCYRVISVQ